MVDTHSFCNFERILLGAALSFFFKQITAADPFISIAKKKDEKLTLNYSNGPHSELHKTAKIGLLFQLVQCLVLFYKRRREPVLAETSKMKTKRGPKMGLRRFGADS